MTLIEAHLRGSHGLNVVAIRKEADGEYEYFSPEYQLQPNDILLIVGPEENIYSFTGEMAAPRVAGLAKIFKSFFGWE
jgi:trk system potassium uptake protein